jgi:hypothetical protein
MSNYPLDLYVHKTLKILDDKIDDFIINYAPENLSIPGNTVLGSNDSDTLTINADTTVNGDLTAGNVTISHLTLINNSELGQDADDTITVNGLGVFNQLATFNAPSYTTCLNATQNVTMGTDTTNTVTVSGTITAPHFTMPATSGNSLKLGTVDVIAYVEYSTSSNIYTGFPNSALVTVKNISGTGINITYNSSDSTYNLGANLTVTFLKTSRFVELPCSSSICWLN